jgi:hypothetical protein
MNSDKATNEVDDSIIATYKAVKETANKNFQTMNTPKNPPVSSLSRPVQRSSMSNTDDEKMGFNKHYLISISGIVRLTLIVGTLFFLY